MDNNMDNKVMTKLGDSRLQHWADILVIMAYFGVILVVGIWSSRRSSKGSVSGYFLASRNMHWLPVGASLFASNIGSGHFVGLAGSGAASGIGIAQFELNAVLVMIVLGWIFVPVYMAAGVYTMPEYLQKRFGGQRIRIYLSVLALILYVFTKISADLFAGALFIEQALGWNLYFSIILLLAVAAIFTIAGGLTAVIWTDFVQTILMLIGSVILMMQSFAAVGGYDAVWQRFLAAEPMNSSYAIHHPHGLNTSCGRVPDDSLHFVRNPLTSDLPWTGVMFGLTISAVWYWCSDQVIVQRALAARNISHAKSGTLFAGYLKLTPLYLLVFPGMIARVLYPDEVGCAVPQECQRICGSPGGCTNIAYPLLVLRLMPTGLSGLMLAVMMAALMSSLTSIFNSSSTIFTMDIWTRIRRNASDWELIVVGRLFVALLVVISVLWIPVIKASQGSQLFVYIQSITSYLSPPICAVYVLAVCWSRINEKGAFWSLMIGLVIGLVRFALEFGFVVPSCGWPLTDGRPEFIKIVVGRFHFLHFGILLFIVCALLTVIISLATEPIEPIYLHRLTYWNRFSREPRLERESDKVKVTPSPPPSLGPEPNCVELDIDNANVTKLELDNGNGLVPTSFMSSIIPLATEKEVKVTVWKRLVQFACGVNSVNRSTDENGDEVTPEPILRQTKEEEAIAAVKCLEERPLWRHINNGTAILLIAITIGLFLYYF